MNEGKVMFEILTPTIIPTRANKDDSGIDFYVPNGFTIERDIKNRFGEVNSITDMGCEMITINAGERVIISLGLKCMLPEGYDLQFVNKSGITSKTGLIVGANLIDNGYRGELKLNLINTSQDSIQIKSGMKIIQGVIRKVEYFNIEVGEISDETDRGDGGFGSTGV